MQACTAALFPAKHKLPRAQIAQKVTAKTSTVPRQVEEASPWHRPIYAILPLGTQGKEKKMQLTTSMLQSYLTTREGCSSQRPCRNRIFQLSPNSLHSFPSCPQQHTAYRPRPQHRNHTCTAQSLYIQRERQARQHQLSWISDNHVWTSRATKTSLCLGGVRCILLHCHCALSSC